MSSQSAAPITVAEEGPLDAWARPPAHDGASPSDEPHSKTSSGRHAFAAMWTAAALSYGGDGIILAAAPLAAATLTSDPRLISGLTVAATLPWALFCLVSGAVVDRVDRVRLMRRIDLLRAGLMAVLALSFVLGSPSIHLLFVAFFASVRRKRSSQTRRRPRSRRWCPPVSSGPPTADCNRLSLSSASSRVRRWEACCSLLRSLCPSWWTPRPSCSRRYCCS